MHSLRALQFVERGQVDLGVQAGPIVGMPGSETSGPWSGAGTHIVLCPSLDNAMLSQGTPLTQTE